MTQDRASERYFRRRAGLPAPEEEQPRGWRRLLTPLNILTLLMMVLIAATLIYQYVDLLAVKRADGLLDLRGHTPRAIEKAFWEAVPTVLVLAAILMVVDRWRPVKWQLWWMAFGWGGAVATFISMYLNTWVSMLMPAAGMAGSAIYSAPFVEELAKASVLLLLAMAFRYHLVNTTNLIVLACASAIGFAFIENIIYYVRTYTESRNTMGSTSPEDALKNIVDLRGKLTAWGHPSFTFYTGLGLAIALKARSKSVRILAPVTGFLLAAAGHMYFNSSAGTLGRFFLALIGGSFLFSFIVFVIGRWMSEARMLRMRLGDYVRTGWLPESDIRTYGTVKARIAGLVKSILRGPRRFWHTTKLMQAYTELAYLREGMVRGVIDESGRRREREIFDAIVRRRPLALGDPKGLRYITWWRRRKAPQFAPPSFPGPAGLGGQWPAPPPGSGMVAPAWPAPHPVPQPPRNNWPAQAPGTFPTQYASGDSTGSSPRF